MGVAMMAVEVGWDGNDIHCEQKRGLLNNGGRILIVVSVLRYRKKEIIEHTPQTKYMRIQSSRCAPLIVLEHQPPWADAVFRIPTRMNKVTCLLTI